MAENAGSENHRIKSFKNKGRDVEVSGRRAGRHDTKRTRRVVVGGLTLTARPGVAASQALASGPTVHPHRLMSLWNER